MNWGKSAWTVLTVKTETKECPALPEKRGCPGDGVTKDLKETEEREETLGLEVTRVTRDGTASREDPKERSETSGPWVSLGETGCLGALENPGRMAALAGGDQRELRGTRAAPASPALRGSRGPEVLRVHLAPPAPQA